MASMSRAGPAVPKDVMDAFWKLGHAKEPVRLAAAEKVVLQATAPNPQTVSDEADAGRDYLLVRLVRGLGSPSRRGFYVALMEVLREAGAEDVARVQALTQTHLALKGSKSEEADAFIGQMLSYGAILRCGVAQGEQLQTCLRELIKVAKKRSYLLIPCFTFITDFIAQCPDEDLFQKQVWPLLQENLSWPADALTLETAWCLLVVRQSFPQALNKAFMIENFGRKKLVTEEFVTEFIRAKDTNTTPIHIIRDHPVFMEVIRELKKEALLRSLWFDHIDESLSQHKTSSYKVLLGFSILEKILDLQVDASEAVTYLTPNVVETSLTLLTRLESTPEEDAFIFGVLAKFGSLAKENPAVQPIVLQALLSGAAGNIAFDKVTGGNVVHQIVTFCQKDAVKEVGNFYRRAILGVPNEGKEYSAKERVYSAFQLAKLVSHPAILDDVPWRSETLRVLLLCTLFDVKKEVEPLTAIPAPLARESKQEIRNSFFKALDFKTKNFETLTAILKEVAQFANQFVLAPTAKKGVSLQKPLTEKALAAWKSMMAEVEAMNESAKGQKKASKRENVVFQLLYLHMGFQLFSEPAMAIDTLAELKECHKRATGRKTKSKGKVQSANEPNWVDVVVDLLLSLLSQNKHHLRQLVSSVFVMLCPYLTRDSLQAIADVINPPEKEETGGPDDDSDYEILEEEEVVGDDQVDNDEEESEDSDGDTDEEDDDEGDASSEENQMDVDDDLKSKIQAALGPHAENDEDSEEDAIDMDDIPEEDMKRMDEMLANVFRQLSKKKGGGQDKREKKDALATMHFKIRALDMIDVYMSHQPKADHVLFVLSFIFNALEKLGPKKEDQPLAIRLQNTLKKTCNLKKPQQFNFEEGGQPDGEELVRLMEYLVDLANSGSPLVSQLSQPIPLYSQCTTMLLKFSQQMKDTSLDGKVTQVYIQALGDFFHKSICVLPVAFFQLPLQGNWLGSWDLIPDVIRLGFDAKTRQFRRTQAISLLSCLYHNKNLMEDSSAKKRQGIEKDLEVKVIHELDVATEASKPRYLCELLALLRGLSISKANLDWTKVSEALERFRDNVPKNRHFQDVKRAFNKIATLLNLKPVTGSEKKNKKGGGKTEKSPGNGAKNTFFNDLTANGHDDEDTSKPLKNGDKHEADEPTKKKKKKQSNEVLRAKKEQKLKEARSQTEDLEIPSFSGITLNENMNFSFDAVAPDKDVAKNGQKKQTSGDVEVKKTKKKKKKKIAEST